jgi:hypothetical protein
MPASSSSCGCSLRRRHRTPALPSAHRQQVARQLEDLVIAEIFQVLGRPGRCVVDLSRGTCAAPPPCAALRASRLSSRRDRLAAMPRCVSRICPTFMRDGTPSGLSTMSTGLAVLVEGHVLDGHDHGDHALVAVTAGHLVTGLDAPLDRQIDLDDLEHARRQVVALGAACASCPRSAPRALRAAPRAASAPSSCLVELRLSQLELEPLLAIELAR